MKLNFSKHEHHANTVQLWIVLFAILVLAGTGLRVTSAQLKSQKRITSFQSGESASGTRVSLFSDSSLNDYEAFRRGDRFYVKIPFAAFEGAQPNLRGDAFEDIQVQRVGDSVIVSFKLQPGTTARVDQRSNRLDVYFSSPNKTVRSAAQPSVPMRTGNSTIPGIVTLDKARNQVQRNPNAAGPMPPDTPGANRPRLATPPVAAINQTPPRQTAQTQRSSGYESLGGSGYRSGSSTPVVKPKTGSSADLAAPTVKSDVPSTVAPAPAPSYSPVTSASPYAPLSPRPVLAQPSKTTSAGLTERLNVVSRWISSNRVSVIAGSAVLLGLVIFSLALIYRRRRKPVATRRTKVPRVQPKYSEEEHLDQFEDDFGTEDYETVFDDYSTGATQTKSEGNLPYAHDAERVGEVHGMHDLTESTNEETPVTSSYVRATPTIPVHAMKHEEYEREVFEL